MVPGYPTPWYSCPYYNPLPWVWTVLSDSSMQSGAEVMECHIQGYKAVASILGARLHSFLDYLIWGTPTARLLKPSCAGAHVAADICVGELGSRSKHTQPASTLQMRLQPILTLAWADSLTVTLGEALSQRHSSKLCPDSYSWNCEIVNFCYFKPPSFRVICYTEVNN